MVAAGAVADAAAAGGAAAGCTAAGFAAVSVYAAAAAAVVGVSLTTPEIVDGQTCRRRRRCAHQRTATISGRRASGRPPRRVCASYLRRENPGQTDVHICIHQGRVQRGPGARAPRNRGKNKSNKCLLFG